MRGGVVTCGIATSGIAGAPSGSARAGVTARAGASLAPELPPPWCAEPPVPPFEMSSGSTSVLVLVSIQKGRDLPRTRTVGP